MRSALGREERGEGEGERGANHSIGQSRKEGNRGRMEEGRRGGRGRRLDWIFDIGKGQEGHEGWEGRDYSIPPH